jgi:hypothetical protein
MDEQIRKIKEVRRVESAISRNLFMVSSAVTFAAMFLMATDFFTRGSFLPAKIGFFYLTVVFIYSVHKEFVRWLGEKKGQRNGEYFVYGWVILTTALYIVNFFSNDFYSYTKEGYAVGTLRDIAYLTIEVLAVFIFTRLLKMIFLFRMSKRGL